MVLKSDLYQLDTKERLLLEVDWLKILQQLEPETYIQNQ